MISGTGAKTFLNEVVVLIRLRVIIWKMENISKYQRRRLQCYILRKHWVPNPADKRVY